MASKLDSIGPDSIPGWGNALCQLGKTLYSHSAPLHPGVQMGTDEFIAGR